MDKIDAVKIIEQRMIDTKDGPCMINVIEAVTTVGSSVVSIDDRIYPQEVRLCDTFDSRQIVNLPEQRRKVGFRISRNGPFGIEYLAIEIDDEWYGLGTLTHYGKRMVIG